MVELDHGRIALCGKVRCLGRLGRYSAQCTSTKVLLNLVSSELPPTVAFSICKIFIGTIKDVVLVSCVVPLVVWPAVL